MPLLLRSLLFVLVLTLPGLAPASPIDANVDYVLGNHPDGNQAPPLYGFRLDGLSGVASEKWTFDFEAVGTQMLLTYDDAANTIWIRGTALGGEDIGDTRVNTAIYQIDFTYTNVVETVTANGHALRVAPPLPGSEDTGTIARLNGVGVPVQTWSLDEYAGDHDYSFELGFGHRDFPGVSGWGWVNHSALPGHVDASDWLFTVRQPIPEPHSAALLVCGGLIVGWAVRRKTSDPA